MLHLNTCLRIWTLTTKLRTLELPTEHSPRIFRETKTNLGDKLRSLSYTFCKRITYRDDYSLCNAKTKMVLEAKKHSRQSNLTLRPASGLLMEELKARNSPSMTTVILCKLNQLMSTEHFFLDPSGPKLSFIIHLHSPRGN